MSHPTQNTTNDILLLSDSSSTSDTASNALSASSASSSVSNSTSAVFAKPVNVRLARHGLQAVHVNAAREMVSLHTRGRLPPGIQHPIAAGLSSSVSSKSSLMSKSSELSKSSISSNSVSCSTISKNTNAETSGLASAPMSSSFVGSASSVSASFAAKVSVPANSHQGQCNNPQCEHCGQVIIPSPAASYPLEDRPSITINNWSIFTQKRPILNSAELDYLSENRFDFPLPEMIFGNNVVKIVNDTTGEAIEFNALDALDSLEDDCKLKVSYHQEWLNSRRSKQSLLSEKSEKALKENSTRDLKTFTDNLDTLKPYDWTYSPNYKGTETNLTLYETTEEIPVKKLLQPDPILFFDESILFEDELGDNGILMLLTKIRVMPGCLLLLCRFFLRIDNVIFRVRDTRVFIDFETNLLLREHKEQEYPYDDLFKKITTSKNANTNDPKKLLRDTNWVSQNIPVVRTIRETNQKPESV